MKKLVIFGVGLIGGSVALALKKAGLGTHIVGIGRSQASLNEALKLNIIDQAESDIASALKNADVILIAAPVAQTMPILQTIKPHLSANMVVTDAGSTKSDVMVAAQAILGERFNQFVGGHPIAGAEKSGASAAVADLYVGKNVIITPSVNSTLEFDAVKKVSAMWQACGAKVMTMSASQHDAIFAAVSHLPHVLAFALVNDLALRDNAKQLFDFAASGFRDFTRIAGSHPEMWRDICLANKSAILNELSAYQTQLTQLKLLIEHADGVGLESLFKKASQARNQWANGQ